MKKNKTKTNINQIHLIPPGIEVQVHCGESSLPSGLALSPRSPRLTKLLINHHSCYSLNSVVTHTHSNPDILGVSRLGLIIGNVKTQNSTKFTDKT